MATSSGILQSLPLLPLESQRSASFLDVSPKCPMDVELVLLTHCAQSSCCLSIYVKGISNRLEHRWSEGKPRSASLATSGPPASLQAPGRGRLSHTWVPLPPHLLPLLLRTSRVTFKNHAPLLPYIPTPCLKPSYGFAFGPEWKPHFSLCPAGLS